MCSSVRSLLFFRQIKEEEDEKPVNRADDEDAAMIIMVEYMVNGIDDNDDIFDGKLSVRYGCMK